MTTSSPKTKLCLHLIGSQFGPVTEAVAVIIFRYQKITLPRILEAMKSDKKFADPKDLARVRDSLLVLTQHNCLNIELPVPEDEAPDDPRLRPHDRIIYSMNTSGVLNRLRIPKAMGIVRDLFGDVGLMISEEFALHGRLGMGQVLQDVVARIAAAMQAEAEQQEADGEAPPTTTNPEDEVRQVFERMAANRFIEPVGMLACGRPSEEAGADVNSRSKSLLDSVLPPGGGKVDKSAAKKTVAAATPSVASATVSKKAAVTVAARGKRKRVVESDEEEGSDLPLELRMLMQNANGAADKQAAESASKLPKVGEDSTITAAKVTARGRGRGARSVAPEASASTDTSKNGNGASSSLTSETRGGATDSTALWTLGWTQFNRYERNQVCSKVVAERLGKLAEAVVSCMLSRSLGMEKSSAELTTHSLPIKVSDIVAMLNAETSGGRAAGAHSSFQIKKLLDLLKCDKMAVVSLSRASDDKGGADASYMVNIQRILEFLRRKTAHSIVSEKFGEVSGRIFELLQEKMYLDQQRISDLAIAPSRDVRRRMYEMYKNNFVDYIDVSKRADFNSLSTMFLWHVHQAKFKAAVLDFVFKALFNLSKRRQVECEQKKEVLELVHRNQGVNLDDTLAQKFDSFMVAINRLDNSVINLTHTLVVMDIL